MSLHAWKNGRGSLAHDVHVRSAQPDGESRRAIPGHPVQNGNDACIAVAEGLSGSEDGFAQAMTEEARALGLEKSTFGNSTGLPTPTIK